MHFNSSNIRNNHLINCIIKKLCYGCKQKQRKRSAHEKISQRWSIKVVINKTQVYTDGKNIPPNAHLCEVAFE